MSINVVVFSSVLSRLSPGFCWFDAAYGDPLVNSKINCIDSIKKPCIDI